jgi:tetratricopeptide (TPR) repeat protein
MLLALEEHLVNRGGLYGFFHDYIRGAVLSQYLNSDRERNGYRQDLVHYFKNREIDRQRVRELPYLLFELGDRGELYDALIDIEFFVAVQEVDEHELLRYVQFVDEDRENSIAEDLTEKLMLKEHCNKEDARYINAVANFLDVVYFYQYEAQLLYEKSLILYGKLLPENHYIITICYNNLASIYDAMGKHNEAYRYYQILLKKYLKYYPDELSSIYNNIAGNYNERGRLSNGTLLLSQSINS